MHIDSSYYFLVVGILSLPMAFLTYACLLWFVMLALPLGLYNATYWVMGYAMVGLSRVAHWVSRGKIPRYHLEHKVEYYGSIKDVFPWV
mgnify:CR=1 FL=1